MPLPVADAAVQDGSCVDARRREHACRDSGARPRLADRHDRLAVLDAVCAARPEQAKRHVHASGDVPAVPLVLLTHVQNGHGSFAEEPLEIDELDRLRSLARRGDVGHVTGELEEADRLQTAGRALRLLAIAGVDDDALVRLEDESRARRERRPVDRHVDGARNVPCSVVVGRSHVEDGRAARFGKLAQVRRSADERAAIQRDDPRGRRRPRRRHRCGHADERVEIAVRERGVRPLLDADRRGVVGSHRCAAQRPGDVSGIHLVRVRQTRQSLQRVEEPLGAFTRIDRQVGPRRVADEQGVTREDEALVDDEGTVLRTVPRSVDDADRHAADAELAAVGERVERVLRVRERMHGDGDAVLERESAVSRYMVGVGVCLEHPDDPDAVGRGGLEVLPDRVRGVDNDCLACPCVADQIGGAAEIVVDELAEHHRAEATSGSGYLS
jgi:hypothetical protein